MKNSPQKKYASKVENSQNSELAVRESLGDLLRPGQSLELLKALHILTRDGKVNQDSRRKLKQVNHLAQLIGPSIQQSRATAADDETISMVDLGAGKAYLGFVLYDLFLNEAASNCEVWGIEQRPELIEKTQTLAKELGFDRMKFLELDTASAARDLRLPRQVQIVTALHACDRATDDALHFAIRKNAEHVILVPCCQAQVAQEMRTYKATMLGATPLAELWRHPLHTREVGSQVTNVLRCLILEAAGYQVTVTELVGWEHSLKNELIIATCKGKRQLKSSALKRFDQLLETFGLQALRSHFLPADLVLA